jgi:hypothetical protein
VIQFLCALLWVLILFGLPITGWYASRRRAWGACGDGGTTGGGR